MTLEELAAEYFEARQAAGLLLTEEETLANAVAAARFYAGYGDIKSLSLADTLPGAPIPGDPLPPPEDVPVPIVSNFEQGLAYAGLLPSQTGALLGPPALVPSLPIKNLEFVSGDTDIRMGEWAIIRPLFILYCDRDVAMRLEASRGLGVDVYGRSASELAQDIARMEDETLPSKCMVHSVIEV